MKRGMAENVGYAATPVPNGSKTPLWNAFLVKATMFALGTSSHTLPFRDTAFHAFGDSFNEFVSALAMAVGTVSMGGVVR